MLRSHLFAFYCLGLLALIFPTASASAQPLVFRNTPVGEKTARLQLLSGDETGCRLHFRLDALQKETTTLNGETVQVLGVEHGGWTGSPEQPGSPTYSGLIAVPDNMGLAVEIASVSEQELPDLNDTPLPENKAFQVDLGQPAILFGRPVVSFTIHPLRQTGPGNRISVATAMDLRFRFVKSPLGVASRRPSRPKAAATTALFNGLIANPTVEKSESAEPGTYVVITPPAATNTIAPLLDWRRRQGYNVVVGNTGLIGSTPYSIKTFLQNIYDTVEPPLEYVVMIGDADGSLTTPAWTEALSGYHGEGDHYYTTLDGNDILPDVHVGRLTARDPTQLSLIINKIINYETNPPMDHDPNWFNRATVVGDPSDSGITTVYVTQWLKAQLQDQAFTQVDTIFGGNFPNLMHASLNQGVSVFGYRGFYAMSGYTPGHISSLTNGGKLPFAVLPTCDTGSFRTHVTAHSEAFLRSPNGGAIGAIGMSTVGTHTRYNNCLFLGIWEGMLNSEDHHLGAALSRGKIEVYNNYYLAEPETSEIWAVWANLMGDPATDLWLDQPQIMSAEYPTALPVAVGSVPVAVTSNGSPLEGALVALYKSDEIRATGYTDAQGQVDLPLDGSSAGTLLLTVTKHNHLPFRGSIALGEVSVHPDLTTTELDDSLGNDDGVINPGELVNLNCALTNLGTDTAGNITATLVSRDPLVTVVDADGGFGDILPGQTAWSQNSFQIQVADSAPDRYAPALDLVATDGLQEWTSALALSVLAPEFQVMETDWNGPGNSPQPGEFGNLVVALANTGSVGSSNLSATLSTSNPWVLVTHGTATFVALDQGQYTDNGSDPFSLQLAQDCFAGQVVTFNLSFRQPDGLVREAGFQWTIGQVSSSDPLGPDSYGYYAIDSTDTGYAQAPVYDWVELNPDLGGPGTDTGLNDYAFEQDQTLPEDLGFTFQYYGQQYDRVSICTNGWIAMGETSFRQYRNFTIPCAGSPNTLIAPFWDNLYQNGNARVYYWQDQVGGRFIVQWDNMRNPNGGLEKFQAVLYDPAVHPTRTGDGDILFQYATVNNTDTTNGFATTGIQNPAGNDGLLYTYWDQYPPGAAPLAPGLAILFTTLPPVPAVTCEVAPGHWNLNLEPNQTRQQTLTISNNGDPGSTLFFEIEKTDPEVPPRDDPAKDMTGSTMTCEPLVYPIGTVADLVFTVVNHSPDNEYLNSVTLDFPLGVSIVSGTDLVNSGVQTLPYNQATGEGAFAAWGGSGFITHDHPATCTMTIDFTNASGTIVLPYTLSGDQYGADPHTVAGTILLVPSGPSVTLLSPNGGEAFTVGENATVSIMAGGGPQLLMLELDRNDGQGWETIATDIPVTDTSVPWLVSGPVSTHCRMRLSDQADPQLSDTSDNWFSIGRDLSWLSLDHLTGAVLPGSPDQVTLSVNTESLAEGSYAVDLIIHQMAVPSLVVPVRLEVRHDLTGNPELPRSTTLEQNHPNPFNPRTEIGFSLPEAGPVRLAVFNAQGRLVNTLVDTNLSRGGHRVTWRGCDDQGHRLSSGLYFYRLEAGGTREIRKMVLIK